MKGNQAEIALRTSRRTEFVRLDQIVAHTLREQGWRDGTLVVFCPHTTAGVALNEGHDPALLDDFERVLDRLAPWEDAWAHDDGNAAAHVKALVVGHGAQVPVQEGRLALGRWQSLFLCEFDGPRPRRLRLHFHPFGS